MLQLAQAEKLDLDASIEPFFPGLPDLGARWFVLAPLHVTVHGGDTLYRRFEFSQRRDPAPGGEFELANGMMFGVDLGVGG